MPETDGVILSRKIKGNAALRSIPVAILSSLFESANEERVGKVGSSAYISQFVAREPATVLRDILGEASLWR